MRFNMTFVYRLSNFESTQAEADAKADAEAQLGLISLVCAVNVAISTYCSVCVWVCVSVS